MSRLGRAAIIVLLMLIGAAAGAYVTLEYARSQAVFDEMTALAHLSGYVQIQRASGTDAAYGEALEAFLQLLERSRRNPSRTYDESVYAVDTALTYARLAELARKRGDEAGAAGYNAKAEAECPKIGWRTCTAAQIALVAAHADSNSAWGDGKSGAAE